LLAHSDAQLRSILLTEADLANDSSGRCRHFDGGIGLGRNFARGVGCILPKDDTKHAGHHIDGEQIVGICDDDKPKVRPPILTRHTGEEANASDYDTPHMIPTEGSFVNLCKSKASPFVRIRDVCVIIVEIVEGSVASRRPVEYEHTPIGFVYVGSLPMNGLRHDV
jgi:hypothetical protein